MATRYMFVDCAAPGKSKLPHRRGSKSEVRAHITKEFHRRLRVRRLETFHGNNISSSDKDHGKAEVGMSRRPGNMVYSSGQEDRTDDMVEEIGRGSGEREDDQGVTSNLVSNFVNGFILTVLGQGRMDPFNSLPIHDMPEYSHQVLDHALVHSWPNTLPAKGSVVAHPVKGAWLRCSMEYPVVFHAFIYAAAMHLTVTHNGREVMRSAPVLRLAHKIETIKLVNQHLSGLTGPPPDALIMAVAVLAVHGARDDRVYPQCHAMSPLAKQQQLHVYGSILMAQEHIHALKLLIQQKGGIKAMDTYGMADTIAVADIYFATKHVIKPSFDLLYEPESLVASGRHMMDSQAVEMDSRLGVGFDHLRLLVHGKELLDEIEWMRGVTIGLDQHHRRALGAPDLCDLTQARNTAQHKMLCLNLSSLGSSDADTCILEICRLSALIFSDMVLFPLPACQQVKPHLAELVRERIDGLATGVFADIDSQLLLWVLIMGSIATSYLPEQVWFLLRLRRQAFALQVSDWYTVQGVCTRFLWWGPICNEPGKRVWDQMLQVSEDGVQMIVNR